MIKLIQGNQDHPTNLPQKSVEKNFIGAFVKILLQSNLKFMFVTETFARTDAQQDLLCAHRFDVRLLEHELYSQ